MESIRGEGLRVKFLEWLNLPGNLTEKLGDVWNLVIVTTEISLSPFFGIELPALVMLRSALLCFSLL